MDAVLHSIRLHSVWAKGFMPGTDAKTVSARITYRIWYPYYYVLSMLLGLWAWTLSSPTLYRNFDHGLVTFSGIFMLLVGVSALVLVHFPESWRLEWIATSILLFMEMCFAGLILVIPPSEPAVPVNLFIFTFILMAMCPLLPRLTYFVVEWVLTYTLRSAAEAKSP